MRIIHVTDTSIFNYDGISTYINELLTCAEQRGDPSLVITTLPLDPAKPRGVKHSAALKIYRHLKLYSSDKFIMVMPFGMEKVMADFNPDLVWIHTIGPLCFRASRISRNKYPVLYTKHCFDGDLWCSHLKIRPSLQWFFHMVANFSERSVLKNTRMAFFHFDNIEPLRTRKFFEKFKYLPPPIEERFLTEKSRRIEKADSTALTIGFCGRLDPEKGMELLFMAADIYRTSRDGCGLRMLLIGDGPVAHELVRQYPLLDVTITGFVDDVIPFLDGLDAFVLASKTETTSLSSLEAYARNLPIFSRRVGFLGQNPAKYNRVHNFETPEELARLIHEVLVVNRPPVPSVPIIHDDSIVTFSNLYDHVAGGFV